MILSFCSMDFILSFRYTNTTDYWTLSEVKGIMRLQTLKIRKIERIQPNNSISMIRGDYNSCYEVVCCGKGCTGVNTIQFCYPSIIITGLPKCGTSAMYDLLSRLPNSKAMLTKENCPFANRRPHWIYFQSLPKFNEINTDLIIIDGCIDLPRNMVMRELLKQPRTLYIVMTRDYAEMLWSSYNFWCKFDYDKGTCGKTLWVFPDKQIRSPEIFRDIVLGNNNIIISIQFCCHLFVTYL